MSEKTVIIADSTQLSDFCACPQLWKYNHGENIIPVQAEMGDALLMGSFGHEVLDKYYKTCAKGENLNTSLDFALAHESDKLDIGLQQQVKNRIREYVFTYSRNDFIPKSPEHVEVGFSECIYEASDRMYILEGRLDVLGTLQGLECIGDHKFQLRARGLYKKSLQFRNYAMVAKLNMLVVNYIRLTKEVSKTTFERAIASFTPLEHFYWKQRLIKIFDQMYEAKISNEYNKNWTCSGKFGYPCSYTPLCEEFDQALIQLKIQTQYKQKEPWKPWEIGE